MPGIYKETTKGTRSCFIWSDIKTNTIAKCEQNVYFNGKTSSSFEIRALSLIILW